MLCPEIHHPLLPKVENKEGILKVKTGKYESLSKGIEVVSRDSEDNEHEN